MNRRWVKFIIVVLLLFLFPEFSCSQAQTKRTTLEDKATELYLKGLTYYQNKEYQRALSLSREAEKLLPENEEIQRLIGASYFQLGTEAYKENDLNQAKEYFFEVIKYLPEDFRGYQNLSLILIKLKNYEKATKIAQRGLRLKEDSRELLLILAECYRQKRDNQKLLEVFEKLHKYYPDDLEIALNLGMLYRINRRANDAMKLYTKLKENYPEEKRVYERIAEIHSSGFRYDKAREEYQALLKFYPDDAGIKERIAELFRLDKKYKEARGIYEELLKVSPKKSFYYANIARIYEEEKDLSSAINIYKRAEKLFPESILVQKELGRLYELQDAYSKAEEVYKKMIGLFPSVPYPLVRLGILYEKRGRVSSAIDSFQRAIELGSIDPLPYYKLSISLKDKEEAIFYIKLATSKALKRIDEIKGTLFGRIQVFGGQIGLAELAQLERSTNDLDEPKEILAKSLERLSTLRRKETKKLELDLKAFLDDHPKNEELLEEMGALYEKENRLNEAVAIWERLLRLAPKSLKAHLGLARTYENLGRNKEAILAYKRVIALNPDCEKAYIALIRLSKEGEKIGLLREEWEKKAKIRSSPLLLEYIAKLKE